MLLSYSIFRVFGHFLWLGSTATIKVTGRWCFPSEALVGQQCNTNRQDDDCHFFRIDRKCSKCCRANCQANKRNSATRDAKNTCSPRNALWVGGFTSGNICHQKLHYSESDSYRKAWSTLHGQGLRPNMAFERDAPKARRPLALRWA